MSSIEFLEQNSCTFSVLACIFLTFSYVASLYVWKTKLSRDHPSTIKRRFFSVSCMMLLAPFFTQYFLTEETRTRGDVYEHLGLRTSGLISASILPLLLTAILFLGPLTMQFLSGIWKLYAEPVYWVSSWQDWVWVRNHFMAPLSEEWVFRACMMPLLLQCVNPLTAVFIGPLLFGVAHFHHMFEQLKAGFEFKTALMISTFQFMYTSLFGAYSAYLFVRTGHFMAPLVAHMFCNHMGFPNFGEISQFPPLQRITIMFNFLLGFVLWCYLLTPLTSPDIYDNRLYYET
ncbi:CAAX prenyl protease 2 [Leguminivora glycinivorella]|uniref:CAAX prenyl protease 2 n=1 Tax=Leguminivora glycinivorella TaxID=1035111 RepID=UPI00200E3F9F|nr:CAAX prenyl protease 2 [Leguminivora glycinivorella]